MATDYKALAKKSIQDIEKKKKREAVKSDKLHNTYKREQQIKKHKTNKYWGYQT